MQTIYKYHLALTDVQDIQMPQDARVLSVGLDPQRRLCLWALVDPDLHDMPVRVRIVGTGNPAPHGILTSVFVGTVTQQMYVWHVFVG